MTPRVALRSRSHERCEGAVTRPWFLCAKSGLTGSLAASPLALHQIRWVLVVLALPMSHQPNPPFERTYARGAGSGRST